MSDEDVASTSATSSFSRAGHAAFAMALTIGVVGCGAGPTAAPVREPPIEVLIPPGATTVVSLSPATIFASEGLRSVANELVSAERLDAFRARHGVDLRTLERFVVTEYGETELTDGTHRGVNGTLYIARGPFHAEVVVAELGNRMSPLESQDDHPMRRAGVYRLNRIELLALGPTTVALTNGPPELAGQIVALHRAASTRAQRASAQFDAPLVLMRHGRPDLPPTGIGLLLARLEHTVVSFDAVGSHLEVQLQLDGEFPPGADANFRALVSSVAQSDLGRVLGMQEVEESLVVQASATSVSMHAEVDAHTLSGGLRELVGAEMNELLNIE